MKYQFLSRKLFSCLIILFGTTVMAQHNMDEVIPGIDGPLPIIVEQVPPAEEGIIGCLHLEKIYSYASMRFNGHLIIGTYADITFPTPSTFGAESYTLQKYDTQSASWVNFEYNNEPNTTTGDNFSIGIDYLEDDISFRIKLNGGEKDGYVSNFVSVQKPKLRSQMTYWNNNFPYNGLVGDVFKKPAFNIEIYNSEIDDFETVSNQYSYCTYKWYRRNPNSYEMTLIEGADSSTYKATLDDVGYQLVLLVQGDDIHYSLFYQLASPIITYPIYSSFEYNGCDGFIINTNYILPENITSTISISYYGEYDPITGITPHLNLPIEKINTIKDGQYAIHCNNLGDNYYEFKLSDNLYSLVQSSTMYEFKMIENLGANIYSQPMSIQIELDGVPTTCDVELFKENIDGKIEAVNITDSIMRDTIIIKLRAGDYYLKVPKTKNYETTYYPDKAVWSDAGIINHPSFTYNYNDSLYVVKLIKTITSTTGSGVIEGIITNIENITNSPARKIVSIDYAAYNLYLTNNNGELIAKTTSDANGAYRFSNVPLGEYDIIIDVAGHKMSTQPHHVVLTSETASVSGADYRISNDGVEATGILLAVATIKTDSIGKNDVIYDLNGKVMNSIPDHGFFIVNGNIYFAK